MLKKLQVHLTGPSYFKSFKNMNRVSESTSCEESAIFFPNHACILKIRQNHKIHMGNICKCIQLFWNLRNSFFKKNYTAWQQFLKNIYVWRPYFICTRYHSRFFVGVRHETTYADILNHHFFTTMSSSELPKL